MAISNHERVNKAMDLLKAGLGPFAEREFTNAYQAKWSFTKVRELPTTCHCEEPEATKQSLFQKAKIASLRSQ